MNRRHFFRTAAAAPLAAAGTAPVDLGKLPVRKVGKVETVFRTPEGTHPNGLQATKDGLWFIDQSEGSRAFLVNYDDGRVLRSFETETDRSSGITYDGESALWIGSTYNRATVKVDAMTGKTLEKRFTPGAGVIYQMAGDPPARSSPLAPHNGRGGRGRGRGSGASAGAQVNAQGGQMVGGFQAGNLLGPQALGTGAHGQEWRDGKLWFVVPPSRMVYSIDPKTWIVQTRFPVAGNRPHGIGWEGRYLWVADSNLNAFFKHDTETGAMTEKVQLGDSDPLPHGMTIWNGYMWYCDDVGVVCRFKMS